MPIKVAAIGVSHWHSLYDAAYLKALSQMPDVKIVGVQDADPALAEHRSGQVGGPPTYSDYRDMLAKTRPDFVLALGRHDHMAGVAHYLLDEGYPFMMEKPMGLNAQDVRGIVDKAKAKRAFIAVPLFFRYHPFMARARRLLAEGAFGPVSHFYFRSNRPTSARYVAWGSPWMLDPAIAGGGSLRNLGAHGFDAFHVLTGEEAKVTGAQLSARALGQPVEDYASVLLRTPSGVLATIEIGTTYPKEGPGAADGEWKLVGGKALLMHKDNMLRYTTAAGEQQSDGHPPELLPVVAVREILARWQKGEAPETGVEDCYRVVKLIDEAYQIAGRA
jgi:predicted dehydrogenase